MTKPYLQQWLVTAARWGFGLRTVCMAARTPLLTHLSSSGHYSSPNSDQAKASCAKCAACVRSVSARLQHSQHWCPLLLAAFIHFHGPTPLSCQQTPPCLIWLASVCKPWWPGWHVHAVRHHSTWILNKPWQWQWCNHGSGAVNSRCYNIAAGQSA